MFPQSSCQFGQKLTSSFLNSCGNARDPNYQMLLKNNKNGGLKRPDFKAFCEATVIKRVCHWQKD